MNNNGFNEEKKKYEKIKNFEELINSFEKNTNNNIDNKIEETDTKIKNATYFFNNVKENILSCCESKGVALSTHQISGLVGIDKKNLQDLLIKLENENKISKKIIGDNYYWKIK